MMTVNAFKRPLSPYCKLFRIRRKSTIASHSQVKDTRDLPDVYQSRFGSLQEMCRSEKSHTKNFILLESSRMSKFGLLNEAVLTKFLDVKVVKLYKYQVSRRNFALVELDDYLAFSKKNFKHDDMIFPVKSRILRINDIPAKFFNSTSREFPINPVASVLESGIDYSLQNLKFFKKYSRKDTNYAIRSLLNERSVSEFGSKLRFFYINQLEEMLCRGMFSEFCISPFGSSVNGFGDDSSDMDMVIYTTDDTQGQSAHLSYLPRVHLDPRQVSRKLVFTFGDLLDNFVPGTNSVQKIANARVPIVKFYSEHTGIECDLSFLDNNHAVKMAECFFEFSQLSPDVRKLMLFMKIWVSHHNLRPSSGAGPWISNFMVLSLVIGFFQSSNHQSCSRKPLPALKSLNSMKYENESNLKKSPQKNDENIQDDFEVVLKDFFYYLSTYEWKDYGISISTGKDMVKPGHSPLFIENPLQAELNVAKNVSMHELKRLVNAAQSSYMILETGEWKTLADLLIPEIGQETKIKPSKGFGQMKIGRIRVDSYMYDN